MWLLATTRGPFSEDVVNDLYVYSVYHDALRDGAAPYTGLHFEYPPGALVPIWLVGGSKIGLSLLMLACAIAGQTLAWAIAGARAGWAMVALPVVAGALVRTHFDLLAAALALGGLALVLRHRPGWGLAVLGLGTMTKLWPAALAALALAWLLGRGERRAAAVGAAAFVAVVLAAGVPFAVDGGFPSVMVEFHVDRPVQIESSAATVLEVVGGSHVTGAPVRHDRFKSNGIDGGAADAVLALFVLASVAVGVALLALVARRHRPQDLVLACFGVTLAFVALGKVLSPQYVCWLLPLAAVVYGQGRRLAPALTVLASLVTQLWFPVHYLDVVAQETWAVVAVGVRNALLIAALVATVAALARSSAPAAASPPSG